jgi:ubiquinone/menaquinone biosynthesis C-methylase UbiE
MSRWKARTSRTTTATRSQSLNLGHYLLGIEGLALLRAGSSLDEASLERHVDEVRALLDAIEEAPYSASRDVPPVDTETGYAAWASSYDTPGNVTVALEEEVVHALLTELPAGSSVLDAGCGTGRHTAFLVEKGHDVVGIDSSPEMLAVAAAKAPTARFELADLERIPLPDASVDAAVCGLVLSHARDLAPVVSEVARVLRPGGRLIVSNPHPFATGLLDWRATVTDDAGRLAVIPEYPHAHAEYVDAFTSGGLRIVGCHEPSLTAERAREEAKAGLVEAFELALTGFPVVIVWDLLAPG